MSPGKASLLTHLAFMELGKLPFIKGAIGSVACEKKSKVAALQRLSTTKRIFTTIPFD